MNWKSRPMRCATLAMSPVSRLSMPTTEWPCSISASLRCDPMKPAAPVMTIRIISLLLLRRAVPASEHRQPHDFEVQSQRPVLDVIEIEFDAFFERRVAAPAVDLRPPGNARLHFVAQHVLGDAVLELLDEEGPLGTRSDDRHIAPQH